MPFEDTPYNQLALKGSHNSYESPYDLHQILSTTAGTPFEFGCRAIELDFARHSDASGGRTASYFQVTHSKGGSGVPLAAYLGYLLSFHLNNPGHDPIFVTLCIKSEEGDIDVFPDEMDSYLREWFSEQAIFPPSMILAAGKDLLQSVNAGGWPTLKQMQGRVIFCVSGTEAWKSFYAGLSPATRLCFADLDFSDDESHVKRPADGNRIVANLNLFTDHFPRWKLATEELHRRGFLVRGYVVNSPTLWQLARDSQVNILATDQVRGTTYASVGTEVFAPIG